MKKLINQLIKRKSAPTPAPLPGLPSNTRVYCIGDIHGRCDLLIRLLEQVEQDAEGYQGHITIVYVGDFIDRGLQSREVVDLLLNQQKTDIKYVYLRGNHEQTLLDFLKDAEVGRSWLSYGGQTTLASYKVRITKIPSKREEFVALQQQLLANLPANHLRFFNNTLFSYSLGSYFFVHAGIHPKYPLTKQHPSDFLWIRNEFTDSQKNFEKIIVHGHTISDIAQLLPNRIGIDTGAYRSGILTCLVLENDQQRLLQTANL